MPIHSKIFQHNNQKITETYHDINTKRHSSNPLAFLEFGPPPSPSSVTPFSPPELKHAEKCPFVMTANHKQYDRQDKNYL